jgi:hypothetical protein
MVLIINDNFELSQFNFLKEFTKNYIIIDYKLYEQINKDKITTFLNQSQLNDIIDYVRSNKPIVNDNEITRCLLNQIEQFRIGLNELEKLDIKMDYICKTRFDVKYNSKIHFYSNDDLLFPHSIEQSNNFDKYLQINNLNRNEWFDYIKTLYLPSDDFHIQLFKQYNFGGIYYYNKDLPPKEEQDKCYMYNDWMYISKRDIILKFLDYWSIYNNEEYLKFVKKVEINFIFAPESQIILFLLFHNINPILYLDNTIEIFR